MRIDITLEENGAETLVRVVHEVHMRQPSEGRGWLAELPTPPLVAGQGVILNQLPSHPATRMGVTTASRSKPATAARAPAELRLSNELAALWSRRLSQVAGLSGAGTATKQ